MLAAPNLDGWGQCKWLGELTLRHPKVDGGLCEGGEVADFGDAQQLLGIGQFRTPLVDKKTNSALGEGGLFAITIQANYFLSCTEVG